MHDNSYILVAGPGRSGSTFIYEYLRSKAPHLLGVIKEQELYKSKRLINQNRTIDISNRAFLERNAIERFLKRCVLSPNNAHVSIVYIHRTTLKRSQSIVKFRRSRGYITSYLGRRLLEKTLEKDFFKPLHVVQNDNVNIYIIDFNSLVSDQKCQEYICRKILKVDYDERLFRSPVNQSVVAKNFFLVAPGKMIAIILRRLGLKIVLQKLKDNSLLTKLFFNSNITPIDYDFSNNFKELSASNDAKMSNFLSSECTLIAPGVYKREN